MKISFVLGHELPFPPAKGGGVNSLLDNLAQALARAGHDITAYSPTVPGRANQEVVANVRHVRFPGAERRPGNLQNFAAGLSYAAKIWRAIEPCDVLSCHLWHGFLFSKHPRTRVVTHTIHRDPKRILRLFQALDRIYTGSDAVTNDAASVVPSLRDKLKTVYNCVDFSAYDGIFARPPDGTIRFLFVGRFSRDKGIDTLVKSFCRAARKDARLRLKTLGPMSRAEGGEEDLVAEMTNRVAECGLKDRVDFASPVYSREEIDAELRGCDVVCLPSVRGETLNMSIIESMRIGRATLISDLPANRPLALEGETGWFAKTGESDDWEEKILLAARDSGLLVSMGRNAFRFGLEKFSADKVASDYLEDFSSLLAEKKAVKG